MPIFHVFCRVCTSLDAILGCLSCLHARSNTRTCDLLCRILVSVAFTRQESTQFPALQQILTALHTHIGLIWEWTRSDDLRLRISACGLIRGLVLESDEATVKRVQRGSLDWGVRSH